MEFAQAEVWGKKQSRKRSERVFGSLELPKPQEVFKHLLKRLSESKRINWYWIPWAIVKVSISVFIRERNLVFPTLSSFVVLSFVFIVWTFVHFRFHKRIFVHLWVLILLYFNLIYVPLGKPKGLCLILRNFSSRQAYERSSSVKVLCIYFKSHFILRPTKGNIRIFAWFCEIVASRQVYERSSSIKSFQSFKSSKLWNPTREFKRICSILQNRRFALVHE